jgi:hypothetical protein
MLIYLWKLLTKDRYRRRQKAWADALAARLAPIMPPGATCAACGWSAWCEPFLQVEGLEWVEVRAGFPGGVGYVARHFSYPQTPTDEQARLIASDLVDYVKPRAK